MISFCCILTGKRSVYEWFSLLLVISSIDKLKSSPLPKINRNDSDYNESPWSPDEVTSDYLEESLRHTTMMDFDQVNEGEITTEKNDEMSEDFEEVQIKVSKNGTRMNEFKNDTNDSPFSHNIKNNRTKRDRGTKEVVPSYFLSDNETDPGKVFVTRTKHFSGAAPPIHILTNTPPQEKIIEEQSTISFFHKKQDKSEDKDTSTVVPDEIGTEIPVLSNETSSIYTERDETKLILDKSAENITPSIVTIKEETITETSESDLTTQRIRSTTESEISSTSSSSSDSQTSVKITNTSSTSTDSENTKVAPTRMVRSTDYMTTVRDVLTTEEASTAATEASTEAIGTNEAVTEVGSSTTQSSTTFELTTNQDHPSVTRVHHMIMPITTESTESTTTSVQDDKETTDKAPSRMVRSTDQVTTVRDVITTEKASTDPTEASTEAISTNEAVTEIGSSTIQSTTIAELTTNKHYPSVFTVQHMIMPLTTESTEATTSSVQDDIETTDKTPTRKVRSTDQVTTVRDVITTEETSTDPTEASTEAISTNEAVTEIGSSTTQSTTTAKLTTDKLYPSVTTVHHMIMPLTTESTEATTSSVQDDKETTDKAPTRKVRSTNQVTTVQDVLTTNPTEDAIVTEAATEIISTNEAETEIISSTTQSTTTAELTTNKHYPSVTTVHHMIMPLTTESTEATISSVQDDDKTTDKTATRKVRSTNKVTTVQDVLTTEEAPTDPTVDTIGTEPSTEAIITNEAVTEFGSSTKQSTTIVELTTNHDHPSVTRVRYTIMPLTTESIVASTSSIQDDEGTTDKAPTRMVRSTDQFTTVRDVLTTEEASTNPTEDAIGTEAATKTISTNETVTKFGSSTTQSTTTVELKTNQDHPTVHHIIMPLTTESTDATFSSVQDDEETTDKAQTRMIRSTDQVQDVLTTVEPSRITTENGITNAEIVFDDTNSTTTEAVVTKVDEELTSKNTWATELSSSSRRSTTTDASTSNEDSTVSLTTESTVSMTSSTAIDDEETTHKAPTRIVRSTDYITTVQDVRTTEKASLITTENVIETDKTVTDEPTTINDSSSFSSEQETPVTVRMSSVQSDSTTLRDISNPTTTDTTITSENEGSTSKDTTVTELSSSTRRFSTTAATTTNEAQSTFSRVPHMILPLTTESILATTSTEQADEETSTILTSQDQIITSTMPTSTEEASFTESETTAETTYSPKQSQTMQPTTTFSSTSFNKGPNSGHQIMPLDDDSNDRSTYMLTATEPSVTEKTPKSTTLDAITPNYADSTSVTSSETVRTTTEELVTSTLQDERVATQTSITHEDVTDSGLHEESSDTNKRSITDEAKTETSEMTTVTETVQTKEKTTQTFTSTSPVTVTSVAEIMPITEDDSQVRSTYMLIGDPITTEHESEITTSKIVENTNNPNSVTEKAVVVEDDVKIRSIYILTPEPPPITDTPIPITTLVQGTPRLNVDANLQDESSGTNKRSIDKTDANNLSSSSSAFLDTSERSTEKLTTVTKEIQHVVTTDEIITNTLKNVETTLETPLAKEPEPVQTTTDDALTTDTMKTTNKGLDSNKLTSSEDQANVKIETSPVPAISETVAASKEKTTTEQATSTRTEPSTIQTTTETTTVLSSGSVYGTISKPKANDESDSVATLDIPTTPKNVVETTTDSIYLSQNDGTSPDNTLVQCNTAPVFSKGDSIVRGGSVNEIRDHDKDQKDKKEKDSEKIELCTSTECVHSASRMLTRMDLKVDPCTDFYEFACGTFLAETHVPSEKSNVDIFSTINDQLQQQLHVLLSEPIDDEKDIMPVKVIKTLFSACMNRDLIEKRGTKPLMDLLHLLGGWPILTGDSWVGEHWSWTYTVARMKLLGSGIDYIVELSVTNDFMNSSKRIVYLDQAATELDRKFLMLGWNDTNVLAYFQYIKDVAIALGANKEVADREAREIVNFEISLGQISSTKESRRELHSLYNPITIRELQHQHPYINWLEYINLLLPHKARVTNDQIISLADKTFIKKLGPLLDNTPKRVLANYLLWHAVDASIGYLTESLQKIELSYRSKTNGKDELDPQWKECVISIAPRFKVALGAKYAREYFKEESKKVAVDMVTDIKEAFAEIIQSRDWMDEDTKTAAMDKLQRMSVNIAYPNELMDDRIVIEYYKGLHVKEDEYFESQLRSQAFLMDRSLDRLHDPVNKTDWRDLSYVAVVNAFYHPLLNYIMFPAGILQEHFFQADRPKYMNYAAIGFVIGHEITHGFDDMGSQFDVEGNLRQWWQNETLEAYHSRAQCIIDQYGNFTDPEVNVTLNGVTTQGENIADNGGLKEAYIAYQKWVQKYGDEAGLPGLNYTSNQLFWISAAQTWCTKYKPEALKYTIVTDSHSPGRFRVMGPFINSVAFANDFECPRGSPMNPEEKCEVW